ncbi:unnamed protein product [Cuscuta campestris]|uniref:Uncharacterized protein n=1 Tax=Cuscuta campestris TaxID=132261 RepID=A0A484NEM1_9ASTE|nr:unnamed protein product [Cuscuta campestris]
MNFYRVFSRKPSSLARAKSLVSHTRPYLADFVIPITADLADSGIHQIRPPLRPMTSAEGYNLFPVLRCHCFRWFFGYPRFNSSSQDTIPTACNPKSGL